MSKRNNCTKHYLINHLYSVIAISFSCLAIVFSIGLSNIDDFTKIVSITVFVILVNALFYYLTKLFDK